MIANVFSFKLNESIFSNVIRYIFLFIFISIGGVYSVFMINRKSRFIKSCRMK